MRRAGNNLGFWTGVYSAGVYGAEGGPVGCILNLWHQMLFPGEKHQNRVEFSDALLVCKSYLFGVVTHVEKVFLLIYSRLGMMSVLWIFQ